MCDEDSDPAALGNAKFWDKRYAEATPDDKPTHEWFRDFEALTAFFDKHLFQTRSAASRILHLGSGDSTIPYDLLKRGYNNQMCIDFSSVVVNLMKPRHPNDHGVEWVEGDVRDMKVVDTASIDVAFDKGTLDAMIHGSPWSPPDEVLQNTGKYINEVQRVLKPDGIFLYVTFRQPHFVKPILNRNNEWNLEMDILGGGDSFEYFGFVLRKSNDDAQ